MIRYHMIRSDDMLNGDGLRVIIFLSGCSHQCLECHNPETWNPNSGNELTDSAINQIITELNKDHISGLTLSGGDPLYISNLNDVFYFITKIKESCPSKTIWMYTGYTWEEIQSSLFRLMIVSLCDVLIDGKFIKELSDVNCPWVGSTNQRVIDVNKTLNSESIVLYKS